MATRSAGTNTPDHRANRRQFIKWLAGSPLLAMAYPALSPFWQQAVTDARQADAPFNTRPTGLLCPDCGQEMVRLTSPAAMRSHAPQQGGGSAEQPPLTALDVHLDGQLIDSVDDAINVWDFEKVAFT